MALSIVLSGLGRGEAQALKRLLPRRLDRACEFVTAESASVDLILLCCDHSATLAQWPAIRRAHPEAAVVCLSFNRESFQGLPVVRRPVQIDALLDVIGEQLAAASVRGKTGRGSASRAVEADRRPEVRSASGTMRFRHFNPQQKIIGVMLEARATMRRNGQPVLIEGMGRFLFFPDGRVFTAKSHHAIHAFCVPDLHPGALTHRGIDARQARRVMKTMRNGHWYDMEEFLWEVAGNCAHGSLPQGLSGNGRLRLQRWPDCTRLANPLLAVAITAQLAREPLSVEELMQRLPVADQQLIGFVSGGLLLGYWQNQEEAPVRNQPEVAASSWSGAVLGRLARHIARKVFGGR